MAMNGRKGCSWSCVPYKCSRLRQNNSVTLIIVPMEGANLTEIYCLLEEDVPGASLGGQLPDYVNVEQLKQ